MYLTFVLSFERITVIGSKVITTEYTRVYYNPQWILIQQENEYQGHEIKESQYWQKSITIL
jgi:hypothetical protein